ncbi:MAG TPA: hypothetical protein VI408_01700 [Gaiellaceae bacterium]
MPIGPTAWIGLVAAILALLALDLVAFRGREPSVRASLAFSALYVGAGLAFAGVLWRWLGSAAATAYLSGYVLEKSLSLDNIFVFTLVFAAFPLPLAQRRRILFWGVIGAIAFRAAFIAAGAAVLDAAHWVIYLFGAFLVATAVKLARHGGVAFDAERSRVVRAVRRAVPRLATPALLALAAIETADVIFALDSIPAIFAVTREPFLVFAANAFAILGLRSLYFLLADSVRRFRYLNPALALLLGLAGAKLVAIGFEKVPVGVTLTAIVLVLGTAIAASLVKVEPTAA